MDPIRINVTSDRGSYQVVIGPGLLAGLRGALEAAAPGGHRVMVSTAPIWQLHGAALGQALGAGAPVLMPDGERAKTLATVGRIYEAFVRRGLDRAALVVAVGGGVVGDTAGFAAATFLRGLRLAQVPTTLLAQVDSAIGGKVGVNLPGGKNLVGAFHPPAVVVCDPLVLGTLPRREFRAGLYEVVKYGVIASRELFERVSGSLPAIFDRDAAVLTPLIAECCQIKARVVAADERESGLRRILNFGHTVGHALEAITKYRRFRHGEAVGYGMVAAGALGRARGVFSGEALEALAHLIAHMGPLPPVGDLSIDEALDAIGRDKKVVRGRLHFVLPTALGATTIVDDVQPDELRAAMVSLGMRG